MVDQENIKNAEVGQELPPLQKVIDRVIIAKYAGASGDFNRIHIDEPFAVEAGLGGVIAHGMLSMGFCSHLLVDWCKDPRMVKQLKVRFTRIVRPGDIITIRGKVTDKKVGASGAVLTCELSCENQREERVLEGQAQICC